MRVSTNQLQMTAINSIMDQQEGLNHTQEQLSTGRRLLKPSDDPVAATQMLALQKNIDITSQYQDNINFVKNRSAVQDELIGSASNVVQRVRELTVRAANITLTDNDRRAIAQEVEQKLDELIGLANTKDASGEYVFGGYKGEIPPISYDEVTQTFTYRGDQGVRDIQVGPDYFIQQTNNGDELFMRVRNGNGTFVTDYDPNNSGTGVINSGIVYDDTLLQEGHQYEISFYDPVVAGDPIEYGIIDRTAGVAIVGPGDPVGPPPVPAGPPAVPYVEGQPIQFDGIEVIITGDPASGVAPAPGDTFTINPSTSQDVFTTIKDLLNTLNRVRGSAADSVQIDMDHGYTLQELDNALGTMLDVRAGLGARINSVESQEGVNEGYELYLNKNLSEVRDLDYAEAASRMNMQLVGLQAAQQVYQKVQGLSLFNYIQ